LVAPGRVIFEEGKDSIDRIIFSSVLADVVTSDSSKSYASKIAAKIGLSGSYSAWGASALSAAAEMSLSSLSSSSFKLFRMDKNIRAHHSKISMNSFMPHKHLTESAKHALLNFHPEQIQRMLGDFYASEVTLGGIFQLTVVMAMSAKESEQEMRAKVEAEYSNVAAKAKGSMSGSASTSTKIGNKMASTKLQVLGGNPRLWLEMGEDNQDEIQKKWAQSVNDQNEYPTNFKLVPIWDLLDHDDMDRKKAKALKNFMINRWKEEEKELPAHDAAPLDEEVNPPPPKGSGEAVLHVTGAGEHAVNGYWAINPKSRVWGKHLKFMKIVHGEELTYKNGLLRVAWSKGPWEFWMPGLEDDIVYSCGKGKLPKGCEDGPSPMPKFRWIKKVHPP